MSARINYYWRVAATGTSFAFFGIGGLLLSILAFPPLLIFSKIKRQLYARWIIHKSFGLFMWFVEKLGIMQLEIIGKEKLLQAKGKLIIANHPTLIDVVALISIIPNANCVVKQSLWENPFLGGVVRSANYISNLEPNELMLDCAKDLSDGNTLIIFPEGTRSQPGRQLKFLRGTARIALEMGASIQPVLIQCTPSTLAKHEKWYRIPHRRFILRIEALDSITPKEWIDIDDRPTVAVRQLTHSLENFYNEKLNIHGQA
ncbi:MAG: 1-acyl-sn-glycerol-3-phosphate acyltransferase [Oxalobacter sp.]|nr:MAG: 1-acyl-sn-glycerol-3-phosphate acyltransferase [Oxalobacter sp.]